MGASHSCRSAIHGTSPIGSQSTTWDQSHISFRIKKGGLPHKCLTVAHGTGPIGNFTAMHGTSYRSFQNEFPWVPENHNWEWSHDNLTFLYGDGPISVSEPCMELHR